MCSLERKASCVLPAHFLFYKGGKFMPKNRLQDIVFSIMMSLIMSYAMELYNLSLINHGLENWIFGEVFKDVFIMAIIVMLVEKLIAGKAAKKLAFRLVTPNIDKPIFVLPSNALQYALCLL